MRLITRTLLAIVLLASFSFAQKPNKRAKNVILFIADAGGLPTVNAASLHGYDAHGKLYLQSWPNLALSDTSPAGNWVTDSAAGMTALVTGVKTRNGVISQGPDVVRGKQDGTMLKTILEYAEERGLSTGVVSNVNIADATPGSCYGHANDRGKRGEIFLQAFTPRFGDGVDVVLGTGRKNIWDLAAKADKNVEEIAASHKRPIYGSLTEVPESNHRPIVVTDEDSFSFDVAGAAKLALKNLSRNKKGYFLMVEWDAHTHGNPTGGLNNLVKLDKLMREIASTVDLRDTLMIFTADHSFDLRIAGGRPGQPILTGYDEWKAAHTSKEEVRIPALNIGSGHTGENVVAVAQGPGADKVRGFISNTDIFHVMLNALGWKEDKK